MPIWVRDGLELEEFFAQLAGIDYEGPGGRKTRGHGLWEEVVVGFGCVGGL